MKLIDKDVLVEEIYRLRDFANDHWDVEEVNGVDKLLDKFIPFINTLEAKEVDLEKEISKYLYSHLGRPRMELELDWTQYDISFKADKLMAFAKHFFELGLKAQKGE